MSKRKTVIFLPVGIFCRARPSGLVPWALPPFSFVGFGSCDDDKGDVSAETTGPAPAEVSAGIQISAERLLCYWLIPKSE
ncbi:hypothetical protein V6N13_142373 [Hibiscus sabdariffa]